MNRKERRFLGVCQVSGNPLSPSSVIFHFAGPHKKHSQRMETKRVERHSSLKLKIDLRSQGKRGEMLQEKGRQRPTELDAVLTFQDCH